MSLRCLHGRMSRQARTALRERGDGAVVQEGTAGFTLIELMVVIAIIVLAAGLMTPTIADFFKNRQLERIRGELGSAFNSARLKAVTEGIQTSLVFFYEGVRAYDERKKEFIDDNWNPDGTLLATGQAWFRLGFDNRKPSTSLPRYREWLEKQGLTDAILIQKKAAGQSAAVNITGLPRIVFERDGSLSFPTGANVSSAFFKEEIPPNSDIMIYQQDNATVCFVDLRGPGQLRSRTVPTGEMAQRPVEGEEETTAVGGKRR